MDAGARRIAAAGACLLGLGASALAVATAVESFPVGLLTALALALATLGGWAGVVRRGRPRIVGLSAAGAFLACAVVLAVSDWRLQWVEVAVLLVIASACAQAALGARPRLPAAPAPERPVLFVNPRSGGGKAARFGLRAEAEQRGIRVVELGAGDDLGSLARDAVAAGADALAMAGGDGSQAVVAAIAAEAGLPYACIPSGTRNHFALDLGVDRDDVVGALDALTPGAGERRVDLGVVNGRVFVNNVSLGVYAEAVQQEGYRETKLRTLFDTLAAWRRGESSGPELRWRGPGGDSHRYGGAIMVSNNPYRLGHVVGSGSRPRLDGGRLGITVAGVPRGHGSGRFRQRPWLEWSAPSFEVASDGPVPAGIDGEAVMLDPPLAFGIRPEALRVRIAAAHPGASPSALLPERAGQAIASLIAIAAGRSSGPAPFSEPRP